MFDFNPNRQMKHTHNAPCECGVVQHHAALIKEDCYDLFPVLTRESLKGITIIMLEL